MNKPLVSISCIAYNQEKYIRDALEGFLIQKTDFPIEIIIHDDASTDNTAGIIKEYENKHPGLIKPIYQKENQYSRGIKPSPNFVWPKCSGKYIATCEGDDYWTDPYKLQKQFDFLEKHPECSVCFHNVSMVFENGKVSCPYHTKKLKPILKLRDMLNQNYIPTCSQLFRKNNLSYEFLESFRSHLFSDWPLHILNAQHGDIGYLDEIMGVYRVHGGGVWSSGYASLEGKIKLKESEIKFYRTINKLLGYKYNWLIKAKIFECMLKIFKKRSERILNFFVERFSQNKGCGK
jgi:glycosyltransferase involved in cell wall biosynthesis